MEAVAVKDKLHKLIDSVENTALLEQFYLSFNAAVEHKNGVWDSLTESTKTMFLKPMKVVLKQVTYLNTIQLKQNTKRGSRNNLVKNC